MVLGTETEQLTAPQGFRGQVKGLMGFFVNQALELGLSVRWGKRREIMNWERAESHWSNHLHGLLVDHREAGAQTLMAAHQGRQAMCEGRKIQRAHKPPGIGQQIRRAPRLPLVQKPYPLLGKGKRKVCGTRLGSNFRRRFGFF